MLRVLQGFLEQVVYKIGSHMTADVLQLTIANATYVAYPTGIQRRYDELYYMDVSSYNTTDPACVLTAALGAAGSGCQVLRSYVLYDWKWYSQVAVSETGTHGRMQLTSTNSCMGPCMHPCDFMQTI